MTDILKRTSQNPRLGYKVETLANGEEALHFRVRINGKWVDRYLTRNQIDALFSEMKPIHSFEERLQSK